MTHDDDDLDGKTVLQANDPFAHDTVLQSADNLDLEGDSFTTTALPPTVAPPIIHAPAAQTAQTKPALPGLPRVPAVGRGSNARPVATPPVASGTPVTTPVERRSRPKLLTRTDIVPELRKDLQIQRAANGYVLRDPTSAREQTLNEYEVSLVRMLNGKRPVFELLDAVERLGIPVNLESLQKFVIQLEQRGFLRPAQTVDMALDQAVEAAWPTRGEWESSVRALFQSGIRLLRAGKYEEAAGYFEALLEEDADNVEARELLAMAKSLRAVPVAERTEVPMALAPTDRAVRLPTPPITGPRPATTTSAPMPAMPTPLSMPTAMPMTHVSHAELPPRAPPPARGRLLTPLQYAVIGGVLLLGGVIGYLVIDSRRRSPPAVTAADPEVEPKRDPIPVVAPPIDASRPDIVELIDAAKPAAQPDAAVPVPTKQVPDPVEPTPPPKPPDIKPPPPAVAHQVTAPTAGEVTSFLRAARKVREGDKLFQIAQVIGDPAKIKAATAKVDEMSALAKKDPVYDPFLAEARAELAKVRKVSVTVVKAPRAGKASPKVMHGATVRGGQALAEIQ